MVENNQFVHSPIKNNPKIMEIYGLNQQQASSSVTIEDKDDDYINSIKSDMIPRVHNENQSQGTIFEIKKVTPPP